MKKTLSLVICIVFLLVLLPGATVFSAVGTSLAGQYEWGNLPIGGGGFVTGVMIHPTEPNLVYIRTDVGGCYRWNEATETWTPLMDMFPRQQSSFLGVDGLALDAHDPDVIYIAAGSSVGPDSSDVLKSTDRGKSWKRTHLSSVMGNGSGFDGNGGYRGSGERIAVDPANGNIVYVGTVNGGLFKSTNAGDSWSKVSLPNLPGNGNGRDIRNIYFDPSTSVEGDKTYTIYVGVVNSGMWRSTDGGATWAQLPGSPRTANRLSMGKTNGILYVAAMDGLYKFQDETWTNISPTPPGSTEFGGVSVSPLDENQIICSIPHPINNRAIWYSTDGGQTWSEKYRSGRMNSTLPWNPSPSINSNGHCIELDWNKPGRVWNTDWFCSSRTDDITVSRTQWNYLYRGLEEMVPRNLTCPPSGDTRLFISVADNRGFAYSDPTQYPTTQMGNWDNWSHYQDPGMMSIASTVYCEEDPNYMAIAGVNWNFYGKVELSRNGGQTWDPPVKSLPSYVDQKGNVLLDKQNCNQQIQYGAAAMSSQKQENGYPVILLAPTYEEASNKQLPAGFETKPLLVSKDWGQTWEKANLPVQLMHNHWHDNLPLDSDKVAGNKFYAMYQQQVYYSEDWGVTWTPGGKIADGWNYVTAELKAAPGMEGEVWGTMGNGLYRSSDGAKTFTKLPGITETVGFGFGKAAPDRDNPTIYLYGVVDGVDGIYRSIDMGQTWNRINDANTMIGKSPNVVQGDMQEFGTVYVTSGGRGVYYGRDTSTKPGAGLQYHSDFSGKYGLDGWSFYLNGEERLNDYTTSAAGYLANSAMNPDGGFRWENIPNWEQVQLCLYEKRDWAGKYTFQTVVRDDSVGQHPMQHKNLLYFNYIDATHYYQLLIDNYGTVQLFKQDGETATRLGESSLSAEDKTQAGQVFATILISYDEGSITVDSLSGGEPVTLITVTDESPFIQGGKIGVGSDNAVAAYRDIHVIQDQAALPTPPAVEYRSDFSDASALADWSFYLNDVKGSNDYTTSQAAYLANSTMNAGGSFTWGNNPNFWQKQYCIYNGASWGGTYKFQTFVRNDSVGDAHKNLLYFNFIDPNYHYQLVVPANGTMELYKKEGPWEPTLLASTSGLQLDFRAGVTLQITYEQGAIAVASVDGESATTLLTATDGTPFAQGGKIGVGSDNAVAGYRDIYVTPDVEGEVSDWPLALVGTPVLTDEAGQPATIGQLAGGQGTVVTQAKSALGTDMDVTVVAALYDGQHMLRTVGAESRRVSAMTASTVFRIPLSIDEAAGEGYTIRLFYLDGPDTIQPLYDSITIE